MFESVLEYLEDLLDRHHHHHDRADHQAVMQSLHYLHRKVNWLMSAQDDINNALQALADSISSLASRVAAVEQGLRDEIAALQAQNPEVDVTGLETQLAELKGAADAIDAVEVPSPPPDQPPADQPPVEPV